MEFIYRIAAAAICTILLVLLLKKSNPELAALLSLAAVAVFLVGSLKFGKAFSELGEQLRTGFSLPETYIRPILKCVAAAVVTKLTADLCRDSSQTAAASAVELAGSLCALGVMMPLLTAALRMLGDYL